MSTPVPTITGMSIADIYQRYARDVFGYVFHQTGDRALGQDLTSETFVRAIQHGHKYVDRGKPVRAWLVTIARNLVRDHKKSMYQRTAELLGSEPVADVAGAADDSTDPERAAVVGELTAQLHVALCELPADQRECLYWRFIAGRSVAETAEMLNRNEPAVRALQHRAIRKLRASFAAPANALPRHAESLPKGGRQAHPREARSHPVRQYRQVRDGTTVGPRRTGRRCSRCRAGST